MNSVYDEKKNCCGCGTCSAACPTQAIRMAEDELGYLYPKIDQTACINCGKCKAVCPMLHISGKKIQSAYAVVLDDPALQNSASGGAFYALAKAFLQQGGIVFGCAFDSSLRAAHIEISRLDDLQQLQGSKYVQSDLLNCHNRVLELLKEGMKVLFSGTPCQIAAIRSFVGKLESNLTCVELVCHGVPSAAFWKSYVDFLEKKHRGKLVSFTFRTKPPKKNWCYSYSYLDKKGVHTTRPLPSVLSYYYYNFLKGRIYRESCYACPYAQSERQAELTICDYWGYQGEEFKGVSSISAVLVHGEKGQSLFKAASRYLHIEPTTFELVAVQNEQLSHPTLPEKYDESFLNLWKKEGSAIIERKHRKEHWKAYLLNTFGLL